MIHISTATTAIIARSLTRYDDDYQLKRLRDILYSVNGGLVGQWQRAGFVTGRSRVRIASRTVVPLRNFSEQRSIYAQLLWVDSAQTSLRG